METGEVKGGVGDRPEDMQTEVVERKGAERGSRRRRWKKRTDRKADGYGQAPLWTAVIYFTNEADIKDRLTDGLREHADRQLDGRPQTSRQELTVTEGRQTERQQDMDK
uniref:Reverse transcriptase domain-containing protein n=1 Tax=Haemonchus contortus TaxID=6289 RepID=A0A7I4Y182_HAECO